MSSQVKYPALMSLAAGAFVVAWLLPNHYPPWTSAYQEFAACLAGLLLLLAALLSRLTRVTPAILGFFLLASVPLLQHAGGLIFFAGDAWIVSLYLLGFAVMLMVGYNLALQPASRAFLAQLLALALIAGAVLSLLLALRQWLQFPGGAFWTIDLPRGGRPYANLAQPNSLATLLCLGLAGTLYLFERHVLGRFAASFLTVFLLFGVGLTQSRTPWVAALAVLVFWAWKTHRVELRLTLRALMGWIGCYVLVLLALPHISDLLLLAVSDPLSRAGSSGRLDMWGQLWFAVQQGPIWGYGWGQVSVAQVSVAADYPAPRLSTLYSHNLLMDLLLWNGPLLGGAIISALALWLWRVGWSSRSLESVFALVAAGFVLVHAMLEYPLAYSFFLFPLGLLLGLAAAELPAARGFDLPPWPLGIALTLAVGLFAWFWSDYRVIEEYYRLSRFEEARIAGAEAGNIPEIALLSEPREYIRFVRTPAAEGMSDLQLDWMRKVAYRRPGAFSLFRYSLALGINGRPAEAYRQLQIVRAQYGDGTYLQALQEFQRKESEHPQLVAVRQIVKPDD